MFDYFGQQVDFPVSYYCSIGTRMEEGRPLVPLSVKLSTERFKTPHMRVFFWRKDSQGPGKAFSVIGLTTNREHFTSYCPYTEPHLRYRIQ